MPDENKQNAEEKDSARKGPKWQDASYKQIYSSVDVVIDLLKKFVDPNVVGDFDPQSFERLPDTFINKNLSERREDKIWRFKTKNGGEFYIFLILEFQTKNVYEMGLRIVEYIALFVMELFRTGKVKHHEKVPNILPIVIYTGKSEWTAPRALSDLFETPPLSLKPYQLDLSYIVIDVVALAQESVSDTDNLSALVFRLERCKTLQELIDELKRAEIRLAGEQYEELRRIIGTWVFNIVVKRFKEVPQTFDNIDLKDVSSMLAETFDEIIEDVKRKAWDEAWDEAWDKSRDVTQKDLLSKLIKGGMPLEQLSQYSNIPIADLKALKAE